MKIIKILSFLLLLVPVGNPVSAQGFFNQKGAMLKKAIKQLALLTTYAGYVKKGYHIVQTGVGAVGDIKNGEFGLHDLYYRELEQVNPGVRSYPLVKETKILYEKMKAEKDTVWRQLKQSDLFAPGEVRQVKGIYDNLLKAAANDISDLDTLLKDGQYKMSDDERIKQIGIIYKRVLKKFHIMSSLNERVLLVLKKRGEAHEDTRKLKQLYGHKN